MNIIHHYTKEDVGFDLDSVLNDLTESWMAAYNKDYNDNMDRSKILTWDTHKWVKPECGKKIYDYLKQPGWFRNLGVQPGAPEVTKWLSELDCYNLHVVTAYSPSTCMDKVGFLAEHYPWIPEKNIIFCNDKGKIKMNYLIDDGPHNIEAFDGGLGIVLDYPYNRNIKKNHIRIYDMLELFDFFCTRLGITRKIG
jgi:5'(3')-deoxyribonucleotidase